MPEQAETRVASDRRTEKHRYSRTTAYFKERDSESVIGPLPTKAYLGSIRPTERTVSSGPTKTGGKTYGW